MSGLSTIALLLCLVIPTSAWIAYFRWKDRLRPEPLGLMIASYLFSGTLALLALWGNGILLSWVGVDPLNASGWRLMGACLFVVGPVEEFTKSLFFLLFLLHRKSFEEVMDGILYAGMCALGFATFENAYYALVLKKDALEIFFRAVAGPFAHIAFATLWGYGVAKWFLRSDHRIRWISLGFLTSFLLHGMYNYATLSAERPGMERYRLFAAALILVTAVWTIGKWKEENSRLAHALKTGRFTEFYQPSVGWFEQWKAKRKKL